jgi:manganese/zinc/iron transport system permease protein
MGIAEILSDLINDYTLRTVALGSATLGIVSGALGTFAVLRKQSLLGDAISHTALPGVALAFLLTGMRLPVLLMAGAAVSGWLGTLAVMAIVRRSRVKQDSALGMVLAVFFGVGLVLLTLVQRMPQASKAGLDTFLFGQASALLESDVWTMGIVGGVALLLLAVFFKEFKLLAFDPEFAQSMGFPIRMIDIMLTTLLVAAIVIGLQTVGVVLMSAMVVAPAAAARQWTDRLSLMVILSAVFGALAGISGAVLSSLTARLPTGPTIVLCISAIVLVSLLLAPNRGLLYNYLRSRHRRHAFQTEAVLLDLFELSSQHEDPYHPHSAEALRTMNNQPRSVDGALSDLEEHGFVRRSNTDDWRLTEFGRSRARALVNGLGGEQ